VFHRIGAQGVTLRKLACRQAFRDLRSRRSIASDRSMSEANVFLRVTRRREVRAGISAQVRMCDRFYEDSFVKPSVSVTRNELEAEGLE